VKKTGKMQRERETKTVSKYCQHWVPKILRHCNSNRNSFELHSWNLRVERSKLNLREVRAEEIVVTCLDW